MGKAICGYMLRNALLVGCILTSVVYCWSYWHAAALPKPGGLGWWEWWDQGKYLQSTRAFAQGNLNAGEHWYPPGYSLLGAIFYPFLPLHPFFVVDGALLLASLILFVLLCRLLSVSHLVAVVIFLLTVVFDRPILRHYILPWTSTLSLVLILAGLVLALDVLSPKRIFAFGLVCGGMFLVKPTDSVALCPAAIYLAIRLLRTLHTEKIAAQFWRTIISGASGFIVASCVALLLHVAIYGWHLSEYESGTTTARVFLWETLPVKLYSLFIDAAPIYGADPLASHERGPAIIARFPWLLLSFIGILATAWRNEKLAVVATSVLAYLLLYASYYDFLPDGLWRFNGIHYFTWLFPFFGLFAWLALKETTTSAGWRRLTLSAVALACCLSLRLELDTVKSAAFEIRDPNSFAVRFPEPATVDAIDLSASVGGFDQTYFNYPQIDVDGRRLHVVAEAHVFPIRFGVRLLFTSPVTAREIMGTFLDGVTLSEATASAATSRRVKWLWSFAGSVDSR